MEVDPLKALSDRQLSVAKDLVDAGCSFNQHAIPIIPGVTLKVTVRSKVYYLLDAWVIMPPELPPSLFQRDILTAGIRKWAFPTLDTDIFDCVYVLIAGFRSVENFPLSLKHLVPAVVTYLRSLGLNNVLLPKLFSVPQDLSWLTHKVLASSSTASGVPNFGPSKFPFMNSQRDSKNPTVGCEFFTAKVIPTEIQIEYVSYPYPSVFDTVQIYGRENTHTDSDMDFFSDGLYSPKFGYKLLATVKVNLTYSGEFGTITLPVPKGDIPFRRVMMCFTHSGNRAVVLRFVKICIIGYALVGFTV